MSVPSILLAAFAVAYVAAYLFGGWDLERTRRSSQKLLRLTSAVLVVAALYFWRSVAVGSRLESYAAWIFAGMLASFLGDLVTGGILIVRQRFIVAMAVFGIGHLCYLAAMARARASLEIPIDAMGWAAGGAVAFIAWAVALRRRDSAATTLNSLALGYALLLGTVLGQGVALGRARLELWPLAAGVVLFSVSDTLLGHRELRKGRWFLMNDVIWATYVFGQLLIVWSVSAAAAL